MSEELRKRINQHLNDYKKALRDYENRRQEEEEGYEAQDELPRAPSYWITVGQKIGVSFALSFIDLYAKLINVELESE